MKPAPPSDQQLRLSWPSRGRRTVHYIPRHHAGIHCTLPTPVLACRLRYFSPISRQFAVALVPVRPTSTTRRSLPDNEEYPQFARLSAIALVPVRPTSTSRRSLLVFEANPQFSRRSAVALVPAGPTCPPRLAIPEFKAYLQFARGSAVALVHCGEMPWTASDTTMISGISRISSTVSCFMAGSSMTCGTGTSISCPVRKNQRRHHLAPPHFPPPFLSSEASCQHRHPDCRKRHRPLRCHGHCEACQHKRTVSTPFETTAKTDKTRQVRVRAFLFACP